MQRFMLTREHDDTGISSLSREFFEEALGQVVLDSVTEGTTVIVTIKKRLTRTADSYNEVLRAWRTYYDINKQRFNMETYKLDGEPIVEVVEGVPIFAHTNEQEGKDIEKEAHSEAGANDNTPDSNTGEGRPPE